MANFKYVHNAIDPISPIDFNGISYRLRIRQVPTASLDGGHYVHHSKSYWKAMQSTWSTN